MLYILKRIGKCDWDEVNAVVVRVAANEGAREARLIASSHAACEKAETWLDPQKTTCRRLKDSGKIGLVIRDTKED